MRKLLILITVAFAFFIPAKAQVVQTLNLKDGSVLYGFMRSQKPGSNCFFQTEKAVIVMEGKKVKDITTKKVLYKNLSDEWKQWAEEHEVLYGLGDNREMTMSTLICTDGKQVNDVYILEKGQTVKYVENAPNSYALSWDDIVSIQQPWRTNTLLSGINRSFTVKKGNTTRVVDGQYIKEIPGKTIYLYEEDGVVESFDIFDLIKDKSIKNNPNQSLFEQSMLLDEIEMKNGTTYKGIITERNYEYGSKSNESYLLMTSLTGGVESTTSIKMSDVAEYRKLRNTDYKPVYDILLRPGDMVINREEAVKVKLDEDDNKFILEEEMAEKSMKVNRSTQKDNVVVEANFQDEKEGLNYILVKAKKVSKKKSNHYEFDYADLIKSSVVPTEVVTSMNHTTKLAFCLSDVGLYVLFNKVTKDAVIIMVE
jgi:hypothetical protein